MAGAPCRAFGVGRKPAPAWMRLHRSGFLDKARKEAASARKCQSLRSLGPARLFVIKPPTPLLVRKTCLCTPTRLAPPYRPWVRCSAPWRFCAYMDKILRTQEVPPPWQFCLHKKELIGKRKPAQWRASKRRSGRRGEVGRSWDCALSQRPSSRRSAQSSSDALGPKLDAVPRADPWTEGLPSRRSGCNCRGCRRSVRRFSRPNRTPCTPW